MMACAAGPGRRAGSGPWHARPPGGAGRLLGGQDDAGPPGVVHHDVNAADRLDSGGAGAVDRAGIGHVEPGDAEPAIGRRRVAGEGRREIGQCVDPLGGAITG